MRRRFGLGATLKPGKIDDTLLRRGGLGPLYRGEDGDEGLAGGDMLACVKSFHGLEHKHRSGKSVAELAGKQ